MSANKSNPKTLIETFKDYPFKFVELPIDVIVTDPNQFSDSF